MDTTLVKATLAGGDRRSIGWADKVAAKTLDGEVPMEALFRLLDDADPVLRMRAADVLEKVSVRRPEWLQPFKETLRLRSAEVRQAEVRWHLAQMLPRLALTADERRSWAVPVLLDYLQDKSRIVQTFALQALTDFAALDAQLRPQVIRLVEEAGRTGSPAVKSRCRRLLVTLTSPP